MYTPDDLFASRDYLVQTITQATATRDFTQDPEEWAEAQNVIAAHTRLLAIVEHAILAENMKPRLEVPCGDVKIVAEVNPDENYHEIFVGFESPDGGWKQDLAIIRQRYHYDGMTVVFDDGAEVAVWSDANNEDFTDEFAIDIYDENNE